MRDFHFNKFKNADTEPSLEERFEKIIQMWERDSDSFEKLRDEIDVENEMFLVLEMLESKNMWKEIEKLDCALQRQPKYYDENIKFIYQSLLPLYLAADRKEGKAQFDRIENCLKPFCKNPVKQYEIFSELLDKLICYDQSSIVVDLCKKTYPLIASSDLFFINPKDNIAEIIILNEFQKIYEAEKNGVEVDWNSHVRRFKDYEYTFTQDDLKTFEEIMKGRLNVDELFKMFKANESFVLFQIKLAFCCQMFDLDGTSFVTSNNFSSKIVDFLASIPGREKCSLQTFFKIKPNLFSKHLLKLGDNGWFETVYNQFAFLGAIPIFLQFLLKIQIIEMKTLEEILPTVYMTKSEFKKLHSDRPWLFSFFKRLEGQSSSLAQLHQESES